MWIRHAHQFHINALPQQFQVAVDDDLIEQNLPLKQILDDGGNVTFIKLEETIRNMILFCVRAIEYHYPVVLPKADNNIDGLILIRKLVSAGVKSMGFFADSKDHCQLFRDYKYLGTVVFESADAGVENFIDNFSPGLLGIQMPEFDLEKEIALLSIALEGISVVSQWPCTLPLHFVR